MNDRIHELSQIASQSVVVEISPRTGKPKRRKAARACVHCQRSHLTCDDGRPCIKCIERGLADSCRDGTRKKAKYLNDVPEAVAMSVEYEKFDPRFQKRGSQSTESRDETIESANEPSGITQSTTTMKHNEDLDFFGHIKPISKTFHSETAVKEFEALNNLLNQDTITSTSINNAITKSSASPAASEDTIRAIEESTTAKAAAAIFHSELLNQYNIGSGPGNGLNELLDSLDTAANIQESHVSDWLQEHPKPRPISLAISNAPSPNMGDPFVVNQEGPRKQYYYENAQNTSMEDSDISFQGVSTNTMPVEIYRNVRKPFHYNPSFRALSAYLTLRFQPEQLMQIAHYMAKYRPSFMACTNSLNDDDLIFMEQCFQRALLDYEKIISYSGTPTVVWRRTGQIAGVGKEFCILTGWSREQLLGTGDSNCMFIVELMDDKSVLKYFDIFSSYAFGDKAPSTFECTLRTSIGKPLKTVTQWTLKRDIFGIPMIIVGNFLPILP